MLNEKLFTLIKAPIITEKSKNKIVIIDPLVKKKIYKSRWDEITETMSQEMGAPLDWASSAQTSSSSVMANTPGGARIAPPAPRGGRGRDRRGTSPRPSSPWSRSRRRGRRREGAASGEDGEVRGSRRSRWSRIANPRKRGSAGREP